MKKKQKISTLLIIVTIVTIGTFFFIGSISSIEAVKRDRTLLADYKNLTELVGDIKNGDFNDDQISLNDFKNSVAYQHADENMQDCIKLAAKIGHNLGDNEIVHCFKNEDYFKQKYSRGNNSASNTNIKSANSIKNATSSDTNMTGSSAGANATSSDTNMTGSSAGANATSTDTGSSAGANATSSDTNMTGSSAGANATSSKYE
ncbi:MAG: nucleoporin [Thaumarchaeota archaeon]|nr:MAG: nucleoporin [Nitrososphaerota archaeon]